MSKCCKKLTKEVLGLQCYEPKTQIKRQKIPQPPRKPRFVVVVVESLQDKKKECFVKKILESHCCELYKYFSFTVPADIVVKKIKEVLDKYANDPEVDFIHIAGLTNFGNKTTSGDIIQTFSGRILVTYVPLYVQYSSATAGNNVTQGEILAKCHFYENNGKEIFTIMSNSSSSTDGINISLNRIMGPEAARFLCRKFNIN